MLKLRRKTFVVDDVSVIGWRWKHGYFCISNDSNCCERFGYRGPEFVSMPKKWMENLRINYNRDNNEMYILIENPDRDEEKSDSDSSDNENPDTDKEESDSDTDSDSESDDDDNNNNVQKLSVYNEHNGYYAHTVYFKRGRTFNVEISYL